MHLSGTWKPISSTFFLYDLATSFFPFFKFSFGLYHFLYPSSAFFICLGLLNLFNCFIMLSFTILKHIFQQYFPDLFCNSHKLFLAIGLRGNQSSCMHRTCIHGCWYEPSLLCPNFLQVLISTGLRRNSSSYMHQMLHRWTLIWTLTMIS